LLQSANYRVFATTVGSDAVQLARDHSPDAVLLDVMMPGISGVSVCAELKQHVTNPPHTGCADERCGGAGDPHCSLAAGADDFVTKPLTPRSWVWRLRSLVRLKRTMNELESAETLFSRSAG